MASRPPSYQHLQSIQSARLSLQSSELASHDSSPASRVSSKQTKIYFGSNRNKPKQDLFRVCFGLFCETKNKKISVCFGLFQCFKPISKQPKQTELFRYKPKQTKTTINFLKNTQIYSLSNCLGGSSVCFVQLKHRNSLFLYRSETTKTNCFQTNLKKPKKPKKTEKPYIF